MSSKNNPVPAKQPLSSKYPEDELASALENAVNWAHDQHSYFHTEGKEARDRERFRNEKICLIARWAHKRKAALQSDASGGFPEEYYEDPLNIVGFAHPEKAGEEATEQDLEGLSVSGAWLQAFAEALEGDSVYQETIKKLGPERVSLYCSGAELPEELLKSLSERSDEDWHRTARAAIGPYFQRDFSEQDSLATSSERRSFTGRIASWMGRGSKKFSRLSSKSHPE